MATIITMPRLSDTMTEGTVALWLKKEGDQIKEGDILAEIETDKATMEFESFNEGVLLHIGIPAGKSAPVDSLLAIIGNKGEDISALLTGEKSKNQKAEIPAETPNTIKTVLPKGVHVITMPRLSDTMTTGTVASWIKKIGDKISEGDILAEIETDKATMEFESFNEGTLLYIGVKEGESAPVDTILAVIGPDKTDVTSIVQSFSKNTDVANIANKPSPENTKTVENVVVANTHNDNTRIFASPLAKKIAAEKGIPLNQIKGSGENGRIIKIDVENTNSQNTSPAKTSETKTVSTLSTTFGSVYSEEIKNSQMRKIIAKRLAESLFTAPHFNLTIEVSMDEAIKSRGLINSLPNTKVSFNDLVIKACAMALKKHLKVNSQWSEDAITINHHINIGVAVAVEDGLVVPVLKFADAMNLSQIAENVRDLAGKAKNKKLLPTDMEGSTFTISNLGMFGITEFNSIINQPNSAILSVGAIIEKPVVKNGQIVVGSTMMLSLACDHRTVDGATGALFLQTLKQYIENPVAMLA